MATVAKLKPGKTLDDVEPALESDEESAFDELFEQAESDAPAGFVTPGDSSLVTTDYMTAGEYVMICFIPTLDEGMPHFAKGMIGSIEVTDDEDEQASPPEADVEYTIAEDEVRGPTELEAGETTFAVTGEDEKHEFFVIKKRKPEDTFETVDALLTEMFEGESPPTAELYEQLPEAFYDVFDFAPGKPIYLTIDLEPGEYLIGCVSGSDDDQHEEVLEVTVT